MYYHGKKYLYSFLKERGYEVPKMKEMNYAFYRGAEWLKTWFEEIRVISPCRGVIYVTVNQEDDENTGKKLPPIEYSKYVDGNLTYQEKNGNLCLMSGKSIEAFKM